MKQANAILGLIAETSIHAGTGQILGAVDLPIEREAHTGWPCVYGSGMKGALRARATDHPGAAENLDIVFGPGVTANASDHAGALAVSDARLLLLPVRALDMAYRWVTCPALLERLMRDRARVRVPSPDFEIPTVATVSAVVHDTGDTDLARAGVFLEELRVEVTAMDLSAVIEAIEPLIGVESARSHLGSRLTLVDDVLFGDLVRSAAIPVTAHVKLEKATKTVDGSALRYEESLPPDTLLYCVLSAFGSRKKGHRLGADAVLNEVTALFADDPYLQIGGNETVGMGWCHTSAVAGGAS